MKVIVVEVPERNAAPQQVINAVANALEAPRFNPIRRQVVERPWEHRTPVCGCGCHHDNDEIVVGTPRWGERRRKTVIDEPANIPPLGSATRPIPMPTPNRWQDGMVTREPIGYKRLEPTQTSWFEEDDDFTSWWD